MANSQHAVNHTVSGVRVRSKIVPAVTELRALHTLGVAPDVRPPKQRTVPEAPVRPENLRATFEYHDEQGRFLFAVDTSACLVEGEPKVLALLAWGLAATCNPMGAGKWRSEYNAYFHAKQVVILPDQDELLRLVEATAALAVPPPCDEEMGVPATEDAIGLQFAQEHQDALRYCHDTGAWFVWTGTHWRRENTRLAFAWARELCRKAAASVEHKKVAATLSKAATASAVERFAQTDRAFAVTSEVWDADRYLLGTPAGVADLRDGTLRPTRREDALTKRVSVAPAATAEAPRWRRFLDEVTQGDAPLTRFLRQVAGYALTGDISEHALFFIYGPGGNGKSVFAQHPDHPPGRLCGHGGYGHLHGQPR